MKKYLFAGLFLLGCNSLHDNGRDRVDMARLRIKNSIASRLIVAAEQDMELMRSAKTSDSAMYYYNHGQAMTDAVIVMYNDKLISDSIDIVLLKF